MKEDINVKRKGSVGIKGSIRISILSATAITFLMFCTSCDLLLMGAQRKYPRYTPSYAWQLCLENVWDETCLYTEDQYMYLLERKNTDTMYLTKRDMETGRDDWKGNRLYIDNERYLSNAVKIGNILYIMYFESGLLYCYSDTNGALLALVQIGSTKDEISRNRSSSGTIITNGTTLYWGTDDLLKLDVTTIDYTQGSVIQIRSPSSLQLNAHWNGGSLASEQLIEDNVLYLLARNQESPNTYEVVAAVDLQTETIKWKKQLDNIKGYSDSELHIQDDVLYVLTNSFIRIDKRDGSILTRYDGEIAPPSTGPIAESTVSLHKVRYDDERLYYIAVRSTQAHIGWKRDYSLMCIDAVTLKFLWGIPLEHGSYHTPLTVANGKIYIITYGDGLLVFDAKTGKLLGADKTVSGGSNGINVLYKNHYIFFNKNYGDTYATISSMRV